MMKRLLLVAPFWLGIGLLASACGPSKAATDTKAAEAAAAADPAAAEKAKVAAEQVKQKAEFDALAGDEAKISDLADKGNGFALYHRGDLRLKATEYVQQQGGFEDMEAGAKAGNADAQLWVGQHMAYGLQGYQLQPNSGLRMMTKAAEQDNVDAILAVGLMYEQDTFMHDMDKAKAWYEKGVALGSEKAKDALAKLGTQEDAR